MRNVAFGAALFELGAQLGIDNAHQQDTRIAFDAGEHRFYVVQAANKGPDMFRRADIGKLRDAGPCNLVHGLACRIGYEMYVKRCLCHRVKLGVQLFHVTIFQRRGHG